MSGISQCLSFCDWPPRQPGSPGPVQLHPHPVPDSPPSEGRIPPAGRSRRTLPSPLPAALLCWEHRCRGCGRGHLGESPLQFFRLCTQKWNRWSHSHFMLTFWRSRHTVFHSHCPTHRAQGTDISMSCQRFISCFIFEHSHPNGSEVVSNPRFLIQRAAHSGHCLLPSLWFLSNAVSRPSPSSVATCQFLVAAAILGWAAPAVRAARVTRSRGHPQPAHSGPAEVPRLVETWLSMQGRRVLSHAARAMWP